jgi:hypothetical protein
MRPPRVTPLLAHQVELFVEQAGVHALLKTHQLSGESLKDREHRLVVFDVDAQRPDVTVVDLVRDDRRARDRGVVPSGPPPKNAIVQSPEERARLEALGYLPKGPDAPGGPAGQNGPPGR